MHVYTVFLFYFALEMKFMFHHLGYLKKELRYNYIKISILFCSQIKGYLHDELSLNYELQYASFPTSPVHNNYSLCLRCTMIAISCATVSLYCVK